MQPCQRLRFAKDTMSSPEANATMTDLFADRKRLGICLINDDF